MSLQGICTSDWHLMGMQKVFPHPTEKQIIEINKPYEYAVEHSIEHVFVPGDISDVAHMGEDELIALVTILIAYDSSIHTHYILGNHDVASTKKTSMNVLRVMAENGMFERFHLYTEPAVKRINGIDVCFMPHPHTEVLETKRAPLVFAHIETVGAIGDNGQPLRMKKEALIRQDGDYVFSGHIHQHQVMKKKRFTYCGSLYQKNFGEALPKGFVDFTAKYVGGRLVVEQEFVNSKPNFVLENKLIEKAEDWKTVSKDESIRYKLLIGEGVIVPRDITKEYPNIIYIQSAVHATKINMDGDVEGSTTLRDLPTFNATTGLLKYLRGAELNKRQIKRAREWVREAQSVLQF
jgi:DNA repair exonuclease SbcCD nuclease subunit